MTFKEFRLLLNQDKSRFSIDHTGKRVSIHLLTVFRFGNYLATKRNIFARILFKILSDYYFFLGVLTGIQLLFGTQIQGGLRFPHWGCIVIASKCVIGKNCTIHQDVTLGQSHFGKHQGYPTIGDNVLIYAGAKICGSIHRE